MAKLNPFCRRSAIANSVKRGLFQLAAAAPDLPGLGLFDDFLAGHTLRMEANPRSENVNQNAGRKFKN